MCQPARGITFGLVFGNRLGLYYFLKNVYLFIWLLRVLVVACELLVAAYRSVAS